MVPSAGLRGQAESTPNRAAADPGPHEILDGVSREQAPGQITGIQAKSEHLGKQPAGLC